MKISLVTSLAAATLWLAGCATQPELDVTDYAGEPVKSFYLTNGSVDGWHAVSKNQLVVYASINKAYLLNVSGYCPDLMFAQAIGITSTANTVDRFEKVLVGRDRCFIEEIRPVDTKQMREDRKLMRKQIEVQNEDASAEKDAQKKKEAEDAKAAQQSKGTS